MIASQAERTEGESVEAASNRGPTIFEPFSRKARELQAAADPTAPGYADAISWWRQENLDAPMRAMVTFRTLGTTPGDPAHMAAFRSCLLAEMTTALASFAVRLGLQHS
jgi:hypothetical protein